MGTSIVLELRRFRFSAESRRHSHAGAWEREKIRILMDILDDDGIPSKKFEPEKISFISRSHAGAWECVFGKATLNKIPILHCRGSYYYYTIRA